MASLRFLPLNFTSPPLTTPSTLPETLQSLDRYQSATKEKKNRWCNKGWPEGAVYSLGGQRRHFWGYNLWIDPWIKGVGRQPSGAWGPFLNSWILATLHLPTQPVGYTFILSNKRHRIVAPTAPPSWLHYHRQLQPASSLQSLLGKVMQPQCLWVFILEFSYFPGSSSGGQGIQSALLRHPFC